MLYVAESVKFFGINRVEVETPTTRNMAKVRSVLLPKPEGTSWYKHIKQKWGDLEKLDLEEVDDDWRFPTREDVQKRTKEFIEETKFCLGS